MYVIVAPIGILHFEKVKFEAKKDTPFSGDFGLVDDRLYQFALDIVPNHGSVTLNNDGTGTVASKANGASTAMEQDIEWELDGSVLKIITNSGGMKITEEMTYENGVITYDVTQSLGGGNSMSMHLVLEKQ